MCLSVRSRIVGFSISSAVEFGVSGSEVSGSKLLSCLSWSGTAESVVLGFDVGSKFSSFCNLGDSEEGACFFCGVGITDVGDSLTFLSSFFSSDTGIAVEGKDCC